MAYLHEDKELFKNAIDLASSQFGILPPIVEKDYYVTMVLRELSAHVPFIVFKGGTSLSKCHKVIKRFSEDIDITTDTEISQGQKKALKEAIKDTAGTLGMIIPNMGQTRSRRSYNRYILEYPSVVQQPDEDISASVLLETSFAEVSFPTVILPVSSYVGQMIETEAPDRLNDFMIEPFQMKIQGIDRTLIDKIFAICDYYMQGKIEKHSRHIYDIHKLLALVRQDQSFTDLVKEVRFERAKNPICPSAQPDIDIRKLLNEIVESEAYKADYNSITSKILFENVSYEEAIKAVKRIADANLFDL